MTRSTKRLPQWVQTLIANQQQTIESLASDLKSEQEKPFRFYEPVTTKAGFELVPVFINTKDIEIVYCGIKARIKLEEKSISISWMDSVHGVKEIAMVPDSFQRVRLIDPKNMR